MALTVVDYVGIISSVIGLTAFIFAISFQTRIIDAVSTTKYIQQWKIARLLTTFFFIWIYSSNYRNNFRDCSTDTVDDTICISDGWNFCIINICC